MGRNRTVAPGVERLPLTDGDWIEVKRQLNTGDSRKLEAAGLKPPTLVGDKIISPIDWSVYELERALIYLTKWSLCGPDGEVLPLTLESIKALDVDSFNEVNKAILAYNASQKPGFQKAEAEVKVTSSEPTPKPTPSSETSGSETTSL